MTNTILAIAAGGAVGAVMRYLVTTQVGHIFGPGFPYGTMAVNILGSLILGALVEALALFWSVSNELRAFLVVGILGSFTTFSTFSMDAVDLFNRGDILSGALYVSVSVGLGMAAFLGGMAVVRAAF